MAAGERARPRAGSGRWARCWPSARCALAPGLSRTARANALIAIGATGFVCLLRPGLRHRPDGLVRRGARPAAAGAQDRPVRHRSRARRWSSRRSRCCSRSASPRAASSRATPSSPAASSRSRRWSVVFTFFPVVPDPDLGDRGRQRRVLAVGVLRPASLTEKIWGLGCIAGSTRCGVAWNTLVLALLCATGCTALGLAFALIATRTDFRAQEAAAHPDGAADHHAAVRHRPGPHPDLRPLGLVNQFLECAFGFQPGALDLRLAGRAAGAGVRVHADRVPGADRRRRGRRRPSMEEAAQTLRANRWRTFADVSLPLMRPGSPTPS